MKFDERSVPLHSLTVGTVFKTELAVDDPQSDDPIYLVEDRGESPKYIAVVEIAAGRKKATRLVGSTRVCIGAE